MELTGHKITITPSIVIHRPFLVVCECGLLHLDVCENDVIRFIKAHWDWVKSTADFKGIETYSIIRQPQTVEDIKQNVYRVETKYKLKE